MKRVFCYLLFLVLSLNSFIGFCSDPVIWSTSYKQLSSTQGELTYTANIALGWHLYSTSVPDDGPIATNISYDKMLGVTPNGPLQYQTPKNIVDTMFHMRIGVYLNKAVFIQKFNISDANNISISGSIKYMAGTGKTINPPQSYSFVYTPAPASVNTNNSKTITDSIATYKYESITKDNGIPPYWSYMPFVSSLDNNNDTESSIITWWHIILAGMICGLLSIFSPLILPMIPIVLGFFMLRTEKRIRAIRLSIIFGGILFVLLTVICSIITIFFGVDSIIRLTDSWAFNLSMATILFACGLSFMNAFKWKALDGWDNNSATIQMRATIHLGIFLMTLIITTLSLSGFRSILGHVIFESQTLNINYGPLLGIIGYSITFSLIFTLLALIPMLVHRVSVNGAWFITVKIALGFILLALSIRFIYIADIELGFNILSHNTVILVWASLFFTLFLYLINKIQFIGNDKDKSITVIRFLWALVALTIALYLYSGLMGNRLKLIENIIPNSITISAQNKEYDNIFTDYDKAVAYAQNENKPIIVHFISNENDSTNSIQSINTDAKICSLITKDYVFVTLNTDDNSLITTSQQFKTKHKNSNFMDIGDKWQFLKQHKFRDNRDNIYVIINSDGRQLSDCITFNGVNQFITFLESGINEHKSKNNVAR